MSLLLRCQNGLIVSPCIDDIRPSSTKRSNGQLVPIRLLREKLFEKLSELKQ